MLEYMRTPMAPGVVAGIHREVLQFPEELVRGDVTGDRHGQDRRFRVARVVKPGGIIREFNDRSVAALAEDHWSEAVEPERVLDEISAVGQIDHLAPAPIRQGALEGGGVVRHAVAFGIVRRTLDVDHHLVGEHDVLRLGA